jgi:dipeptidyl aminopeptidase/acylaminoacyl peptidase
MRQSLKATMVVLFFCILAFSAASPSPAQTAYQKPPQAVLDILYAPTPPQVSLSPVRDMIALIETVRYPSIANLAEPMLRLAGDRINPNTNGPHRPPRVTGLTLVRVSDGKSSKVALPANGGFGGVSWSADGKYLALTNTPANTIELWVVEAATARARKIPGISINAAFGEPVQWMPDQRTLLVQAIPAGRGKAPTASPVPKGPTIQENSGGKAPVWTFEDLLKNAYDEDLFDYYCTAQLLTVDISTGKWTPVGNPAVFQMIDPSPDEKFFLVSRIQRPYSYLVTSASFPKDVEVWDKSGSMVYRVASLPLQEQVQADGVPTGPRNCRWQASDPAALVWIEALDEGNPRAKAPFRDKIMRLKAPFKDKPQELAKTEFRAGGESRSGGMTWTEKGGHALLSEVDRPTRKARTWLINADKPGDPPRKIWDRNAQDRYNDPGAPLTRVLPNGQRALRQNGDLLFLTGQGASPQGNRPFLDEFDLQTLQSKRIYQCATGSLETVLDVLSDDGSKFLTRYETPSQPPTVLIRTRDGSEKKALTEFKDPTPQLRKIKKQLVTYKRADGVQCSFILYLPPDYTEGQKLPTVIWAYPLEFTAADMASQVTGSPYTFTTISGMSHLFFLTQGYAVLDNTSVPVVGDAETVNNTYIEQIVGSAKAAIDKAVEMGVTDRDRAGVGGHSYGAFMTANLLSHCDLFRAGIARSGAYNRTLTPFGFQSERRTIWEAPDMYMKVSPFMFANKINTPILLIHGEADNNSGTFPIQSERYYHALKGNGKVVRYVTLPLESHGYSARESIEHTLYEMISWFDKHVKNAGPRK